jgi:hypothetical protein
MLEKQPKPWSPYAVVSVEELDRRRPMHLHDFEPMLSSMKLSEHGAAAAFGDGDGDGDGGGGDSHSTWFEPVLRTASEPTNPRQAAAQDHPFALTIGGAFAVVSCNQTHARAHTHTHAHTHSHTHARARLDLIFPQQSSRHVRSSNMLSNLLVTALQNHS